MTSASETVVERCGPKIAEWTAWLAKASKKQMRHELVRLYSSHIDDIDGDLACKIMSYDDAHLDAEEMGYPSLTEALEHLSELRAHSEQQAATIAERDARDREIAHKLQDARNTLVKRAYSRPAITDDNLILPPDAFDSIVRSLDAARTALAKVQS